MKVWKEVNKRMRTGVTTEMMTPNMILGMNGMLTVNMCIFELSSSTDESGTIFLGSKRGNGLKTVFRRKSIILPKIGMPKNRHLRQKRMVE